MLHYNKAGEPAALITSIQPYTIHDGPGIRTAVFFKGCPQHCIWCSNPETINPGIEFGIYPDKCLSRDKCTACVRNCPKQGALLSFSSDGKIQAISRTELCGDCFLCAERCPSRAIKLWGEYKTVPELMQIILADRSFYQRSGGGVTLNGGEVMLQWEIAVQLLEACKAASIHTCVETALNCPPEHMNAVLRYTDLVIADIKHMTGAKHAVLTGMPNEQILSNLQSIVDSGKKLIIRTPVVPGYNDDTENIRKTAEFIRDELHGKIAQYQLLPYRRLGTEKYVSLGIEYPLEAYAPPESAAREAGLRELAETLRKDYGIPVVAGAW